MTILKLFLTLLGANETHFTSEWDIAFEPSDFAYLAEPTLIYEIKKDLNVIGKKDDVENSSLDDLVMMVSSQSQVHYVFEIKEVIFGEDKKSVSLSFYHREDAEACTLNNDFQNHSDEKFWREPDLGRAFVANHPESHMIHTCFELGQTYLLLNRKKFKQKAFELINSKEDLWYQYIKDLAENKK